jgi:shikimate kinase
MEHILIVGMRGVGKSTIGKKLAESLQAPFLDTDLMMAQDLEMSLKEFVEESGWESFREKERQTLERVLNQEPSVISTGGGILMHFNNKELVKNAGTVIWLDAPLKVLEERITESPGRPSLTGEGLLEELETVLSQRKKHYKEAAHITINTKKKTPQEIVTEIILELDKR